MLIGPNSSDAVALYPANDGFSASISPIQNQYSRSADGSFIAANEAKFRRWTMDLGFVPAATAGIIQSWWLSQASLYLWPDENTWPNSCYPVQLTNKTMPLDEWQKPYYGVYATGKLYIEATTAGAVV